MRNLVLISLIAITTAGCLVPKKKFDALTAEKYAAEKQLRLANGRIDSLDGALTGTQDQVSDLESDTTAMGERLRQALTQLETITKNYTQLRANSSEQMKKLLDQLEGTRKDLTNAQVDLSVREKRLNELEDLLSKRDENLSGLKDKLENALFGFKQSGLSLEQRDGKVYVSLTDKLLFGTGSIVMDNKGKDALKEVAKVLQTVEDVSIMVEGHTDSIPVTNLGAMKDNWDLSVLRATSVVRFLTIEQGLNPSIIIAAGRSDTNPVATNTTPEGRSKNRRIEVVLTPNLDKIYQLLGND
ncbi:MAG: chemotaxis protein MotB [Sphingobacteriales bacterium]|jgi:chemotaxis protein MotB